MALILDLPMQDNAASTTVVADVGSNFACGVNTSTRSVAGPGGRYPLAMSFANSVTHGISSVSNVDLSGTDKCSVVFWANFSNVTVTQIMFEMSTNQNNVTTGFVSSFENAPAPASLASITVALRGNNGYNIRYYVSPATGQWGLYSYVYDKSQPGGAPALESRLYVDGSEPTVRNDSFYTTNSTNNFGTLPFFIGSRNNASLPLRGASIAGFRLFDHALTAGEIAQLVNELTASRRNNSLIGCAF